MGGSIMELLIIPTIIIWRLYDGRGYPKSEIMGWALACLIAAGFAYGLPIADWGHALAVCLLAFSCMILGYDRTITDGGDDNGWRSYRSMLWRSRLAAGIPIVGVIAAQFGATVSAYDLVMLPVLCVLANVTEVPFRRYQLRLEAIETARRKQFIADGGSAFDYKPGLVARYIAHWCEAWEAAWIGTALALQGFF